MTNTTKKSILASLLIITSVALLVTGIFSFFSDRGDVTATGVAGTVEINVAWVKSDTAMKADLANINPGDHDWNLAEFLGFADWDATGADKIASGSVHPITISVENLGNKSVKVRNSIDLVVYSSDGDPLYDNEFMFFLTETANRIESTGELGKKYYLFGIDPTLYFDVGDEGVTVAGYYKVDQNDKPDNTYTPLQTSLITCNGIRYVIFDSALDSGHILQGTGAGAEAETSDGIAADQNPGYTYYLGLKAQADNKYQEANVEIVWSVEAIQHRNTDNVYAWQKITSLNTTSGKIPKAGEAADGVIIP